MQDLKYMTEGVSPCFGASLEAEDRMRKLLLTLQDWLAVNRITLALYV
jgi:hypothetical protein